ncbi:right-handed parallel beta-helix repeat-containing protein [Candidatus Pacearchaeota archaeon]|nr:right-handed parallel beta-helix repeat-containing protein [Candidatus Pacearchaeota archaeon]
MNKEGLSEIITTVLITLTAIVSVGIVAVVLTNNNQNYLNQISQDVNFIGIDFSISEFSTQENPKISFLLERKSGGKEISGFYILLRDSNGLSSLIKKYSTTQISETQKIWIYIDESDMELELNGQIIEISIYPLRMSEEGEEIISQFPDKNSVGESFETYNSYNDEYIDEECGRYADNLLAADCLDGKYNIETRKCNGEDGNAYSTVQKAADSVLPGETVCIRAGTYSEGVTFRRGGEENNYATFRPYYKEKVVFLLGKTFNTWQNDGSLYSLDLTSSFSSGYFSDSYFVGAIENKGVGISTALSYEHLLNPALRPISAQGIDMTFFDTASKILYLDLEPERQFNPEEFYVVDASKRIYIGADYFKLIGVNIEYPWYGIVSWSTTGVSIINTTILHTSGMGILGDGSISIIGNNISDIGLKIIAKNDKYSSSLIHGIYVSGKDIIIKNNFLSNCAGSCVHPWSQIDVDNKPYNATITGNYIIGAMDLSGSAHTIANNIVLSNGYIWALTLSSVKNTNIVNNYFQGSNPLGGILYLGTPWGDVSSSNDRYSRKVNFVNNIVVGNGPLRCVETAKLDIASGNLDNNLYYNCNQFAVGESPNRVVLNNFEDYRSELQKIKPNVEDHSSFSNPLLDVNYLPTDNSPALNNGIITSLHCPFTDDNPAQPMDKSASCLHWFENAPDIGILS